MDQQSVRIP